MRTKSTKYLCMRTQITKCLYENKNYTLSVYENTKGPITFNFFQSIRVVPNVN